MADRDLAGMLAFLRRAGLAPAEAVQVAVTYTSDSSTETCDGLFDDEEVIVTDSLGSNVQETQTVVRIAESLITRPVLNDALTITRTDATTEAYMVREVRKDPQQPGMWRIVLARA